LPTQINGHVIEVDAGAFEAKNLIDPRACIEQEEDQCPGAAPPWMARGLEREQRLLIGRGEGLNVLVRSLEQCELGRDRLGPFLFQPRQVVVRRADCGG
jgi:hypothetical protein